jgi:hypothetical protein
MHTEYENANIRIFRVETSDDRPSRRFSRKPRSTTTMSVENGFDANPFQNAATSLTSDRMTVVRLGSTVKHLRPSKPSDWMVSLRLKGTTSKQAGTNPILTDGWTRRVEDITEALWGTRVSPSTVSELEQEDLRKIEAWRNRSSLLL